MLTPLHLTSQLPCLSQLINSNSSVKYPPGGMILCGQRLEPFSTLTLPQAYLGKEVLTLPPQQLAVTQPGCFMATVNSGRGAGMQERQFIFETMQPCGSLIRKVKRLRVFYAAFLPPGCWSSLAVSTELWAGKVQRMTLVIRQPLPFKMGLSAASPSGIHSKFAHDSFL